MKVINVYTNAIRFTVKREMLCGVHLVVQLKIASNYNKIMNKAIRVYC